MPNQILRALPPIALSLFFCSCATDDRHVMEVSIVQQRLALYQDGIKVREYPVSTSKFGIGDTPNSNFTPLGQMKVAKKVGTGAPSGTGFKSRKPTGEILPPNSPGRDPIVSRIIWLAGTEPINSNAYGRYIYIHGTPEESKIGTKASYGCIRMRSRDIIDLYEFIGRGAKVYVVNLPLTPPQQFGARYGLKR